MPMLVPDKIAHSPTEAAKALGIGRSTLFALLAQGKLSASKLGTRTLITTEELHRYLASLPKAEFHAHASQGC